MRKPIAVVCLCFALLLNLEQVAFGAAAVKLTMQYWDEFYDIVKNTLKITVNKGDDFVRYVKNSNKIDDLTRLMPKMPSAKRGLLLLEMSAVRGQVSPTDMMKLQPLLKTVPHADDVLLTAIKNGDDAAKALRTAGALKTAAVAPLSMSGRFVSALSTLPVVGTIFSSSVAVLAPLIGVGFSYIVSLVLSLSLLIIPVLIIIFGKFFAKTGILFFRLLKQALSSPVRKQ